MSLQAVDIKYILQHILTSPETLGITSTYTGTLCAISSMADMMRCPYGVKV